MGTVPKWGQPPFAALRPMAALNFAKPGRGQAMRSALTLELTKDGWRQFILTQKQLDIITEVVDELRPASRVDRRFPFYKSLNVGNRLRRFRAQDAKGVDICSMNDRQFYHLVRQLAHKKGVSFPGHWLLVAAPSIAKDLDGVVISAEIVLTDVTGEILEQIIEEQKEVYAKLLDHQLGNLESMSTGGTVAIPRPHAILPVFMDLFTEQFDPPETKPYKPAEYPPFYEHQDTACDNLEALVAKGATRAILQHSTGSGKTRTSARAARTFVDQRGGGNVLYLVHTRIVRDQALDEFAEFWPVDGPRPPAVYIGQMPIEEALQKHQALFVSCQYAVKHLDDFPRNAFSYIIIDEAHRAANPTYQKIINHFKPGFLLGLSGTTLRADGVDVTIFFDGNVADRKSVPDLQELEILPPVRILRVETNIQAELEKIGGDFSKPSMQRRLHIPQRDKLIVNTFLEMIGRKRGPKVWDADWNLSRNARAFCFAVSVNHAVRMAEAFRAAGIPAQAIHSGTSASKLRTFKRAFKRGDLQVLVACDMLNEGVDLPEVEVLLMARPTLSQVLLDQQLGRGLRKSPGKDALWVVDFVDNTRRVADMPLSLHRVFKERRYFPGQYILAPRRIKTLQLKNLRITGGEEVGVQRLPMPIGIEELAERTEVFPQEIVIATNGGPYSDELKQIFFPVDYKRVGRKTKKSLFVLEADVPRVRAIMEKIDQDEIEHRNMHRGRLEMLERLRHESDRLGPVATMNGLAAKRGTVVYYRDREVLSEILSWLCFEEEESRDPQEDESLRRVLEEQGGRKIRAPRHSAIQGSTFTVMLEHTSGPMVKRLLRELYEEKIKEGSAEEAAFPAALLAFKNASLDKEKRTITQGLKADNYFLSYVSARALLHLTRRQYHGKARGHYLQAIKRELEETLKRYNALGRYDFNLYRKANALVIALAEHYHILSIMNRRKDAPFLDFMLNYVVELKKRRQHMDAFNADGTMNKDVAEGMPGILELYLPPMLLYSMRDHMLECEGYRRAVGPTRMEFWFEAVVDIASDSLDHDVREFTEYAPDAEHAIRMLEHEIKNGRDANIWGKTRHKFVLAWHMERVRPEVMLARLKETLANPAKAGDMHYIDFGLAYDYHMASRDRTPGAEAYIARLLLKECDSAA